MKVRSIARWVLLVMSASTLAYAQAPPARPEVERSKELFAEGRRLVDAGNCKDGVRKLEESLRYAESIGVRLSIAECAKNAPLEAWRQLKMAELLALKQGDDRAAFARAQADALEPRLALIRVEVSPGQRDLPGFEMRIDHATVEPLFWKGGKLALEPGRHLVQASARGKRDWTREIDATIGTEAPVPVTLDEETPPSPSSPRSPSEDVRREGSTQQLVGLVLGGVGVAGIVVGAVAGAITLSKKSDLVRSCEVGGGSYGANCGAGTIPSDQRPGLSSDYDGMKTAATVSTVSLVAGAVLLAGGAALVLTAPHAPTTVAVTTAPGGGGIAVGRAW
jgi:hypothetical protein